MVQVLLLSCGLRWFFWFSLCHPTLLATGLAFLWWSNSLLLLCTASIIFQWASAVAAGRVTAQEMQQSKRLTIHHPLVVLHTVHLFSSIGGGIDLIARGLHSAAMFEDYQHDAQVFLVVYRVISVVTVAVDAMCATYVAYQLRARLLSAAMSDDMKHKSVIQMTLLTVCIGAALIVQVVMEVVVLIQGGLLDAWGQLPFTTFCILTYLVPAVLLSLSFLYIMRRVEQRDPTRLVVVPAQSLVEFVECSSPNCVWCAHHRRYHANQTKWDITLFTAFSPQTVDSSYRSVHSVHSSTHANLSIDSWASLETPDGHHSSHFERDPHYRLHQAHGHPPHGHPPHDHRGQVQARFS